MAEHLIVIAGPTASGKTSVAIQVAQQIGAEIISADSRQVYKELRIGVARPSESELLTVKHHLIAGHSIFKSITAAQYAQEAADIIANLPQKNVVLVGGTGLYINALLHGLDDVPQVDTAIRQHWTDVLAKEGFDKLKQVIKAKDPDFFTKGEIDNPQRVLRALEVFTQTGKSITSFWSKSPIKSSFTYTGYCLSHETRSELYGNIETRVDKMMAEGLWEEASSLFEYRHLPVLQTIGYKEIFDAIEGRLSKEEAIDKIKQHTRNYAKRQITWFRNKADMQWVLANQAAETIIKNTKAG